MISFYPGPSRVFDETPSYVKDAYKKGIMSINHRSEEFVTISKRTIDLLKEKLNIPENYTILYTSSATECWEIIAQSLITDKSIHIYNGAFGEKWFEYTRRIRSGATPEKFSQEETIDAETIKCNENELICLTQNETSNGTQVSNSVIREIRKNNPKNIIAVDVTSSLAGVNLDIGSADIWFASVQKCFGLPAGLALMICSPQAVEKAKAVNDKKYYNSMPFMLSMMEKWQTPFTPNVLGIYLLMRVMENSKPIEDIHKKVVKRYNSWISFLKESESISHLIENKKAHSHTVIPITASPEQIDEIKKSAKKKGLLLGEGYGDLKTTTFRIANFPAIKKSEIQKLQEFLVQYS